MSVRRVIELTTNLRGELLVPMASPDTVVLRCGIGSLRFLPSILHSIPIRPRGNTILGVGVVIAQFL